MCPVLYLFLLITIIKLLKGQRLLHACVVGELELERKWLQTTRIGTQEIQVQNMMTVGP